MKSSGLIRTIFDNVSFPVLLIDRDYKIVEANRAALSHVNHRGIDVIGRCCFKVTHAAEEPCWRSGKVVCPVKDAFEVRKRVHAIHRHQVKGRVLVEEIVATPLDEVTGEVNYVVEEFRDITELLELREGILAICASCKKIFEAATETGTASRSTSTITRGQIFPIHSARSVSTRNFLNEPL